MKKIIKISTWMIALLLGLSSCNDFFDTVPGQISDMDDTFTNKNKTLSFLANVYSYVPSEDRERYFWDNDTRGGIWTSTTIEANYSWDWHASNNFNQGDITSSSQLALHFYQQYYKGIARAGIFIANVDKCTELATDGRDERPLRKAEARALRAYFYFMLLRIHGPIPLLGEEPIDMDTPLADMLKARNTVDECVSYIVSELEKAYTDLPTRATRTELGRIDKAFCKAYIAQTLLYAASPLFNGNPDMASLKNNDGTQLIPTTEDPQKWIKARDAYKSFLDEFVPQYFDLYYKRTADNKIDHYASYRTATGGQEFVDELVFLRMVDNADRFYEITPCHKHIDNDALKGGLGFSTTQEMVDLHFTDKGLRIEDDPDYVEYTGIPGPEHYGWPEDYNDPVVPERTYFLKNENKTLKQWAHREPRFYVNITFNGSTWVNDQTSWGKVTTELNLTGNSGFEQCGWDTPYGGYGLRKMAADNWRTNRHYTPILRLAEIYLGYAETLSATNDFTTAMKYVNMVRNRAGIAEYGTGTDENGYTRIPYPANREDVDKRIRRERLIELAFEWNHYFDVRRWLVADMAEGDGWIYPSWHKGGEGGSVSGLNYRKDPPEFFEKAPFETRHFEKKHYLLPIADEEVRRNPLMVQNPGWEVEEE
ncbi:MAG: RagB/SusD family nutrient uptake outer membrane protein [Bacteroides sp.]|nr:RagB/SusD family nutrient uptake outer membrane protein [Bacteroides sp.]